jgi:excinuclease ABC subunit C
MEEQKITTGGQEDEDIVGMAGQDGVWVVTVMARRGGKITGKLDYTARGGTDEHAVLEQFLSMHYAEAGDIPRRVLLPFPIRDQSMLQQFLQREHGKAVRFLVPARGMNRRLVELAARNAVHAAGDAAARSRKSALLELQRVLELDREPRVIESFDVATLLGEHSVAGMVRFADGSFDRRRYRKFRIRYTPELGDVDMLKEAVARRYQRLLNEKAGMPDLVMVDGGRPQVNAARTVLDDLGLRRLPVVGLAKRLEHLYTGDRGPIVLEKRNEALRLLMSLRDETHRFAHTYHLSLRAGKALCSRLERLPGVGKKLAGSVLEAVRSSSGPLTLELLKGIRGIGERRARLILQALNPPGGETASDEGPPPGREIREEQGPPSRREPPSPRETSRI